MDRFWTYISCLIQMFFLNFIMFGLIIDHSTCDYLEPIPLQVEGIVEAYVFLWRSGAFFINDSALFHLHLYLFLIQEQDSE